MLKLGNAAVEDYFVLFGDADAVGVDAASRRLNSSRGLQHKLRVIHRRRVARLVARAAMGKPAG